MLDYQNIAKALPERATVKGALAGTLATLPMTVFMLATQRFLPRGQRYELPPELLVKEMSKRAHIRLHWNKKLLMGATVVSHFGYGAAMGVLYSPIEKQKSLPRPLTGTLFGLWVWASNYLGLLPLLRMRASGPREPGQRNLMMIAAHVVWGSALGAISALFPRKSGLPQKKAVAPESARQASVLAR